MDKKTKIAIDGIYDVFLQHNKISKEMNKLMVESQKQFILLFDNVVELQRRVEEIENKWKSK